MAINPENLPEIRAAGALLTLFMNGNPEDPEAERAVKSIVSEVGSEATILAIVWIARFAIHMVGEAHDQTPEYVLQRILIAAEQSAK